MNPKTGQAIELFPGLPKGSFYQSPSFLKRFKKLAFVRLSIAGKTELFVGNPKNMDVELLVQFDGWINPSFSPNEHWFAYFSAPSQNHRHKENQAPGEKLLSLEQLIIQNVDSGERISLADDVAAPGPRPLWLSNLSILYINQDRLLSQINIENKEKKIWGKFDVAPLALSPDGTQIICIDDAYPASTIYLMDVSKKSIKPIKKYSHIGRTILWAPDGQSFIFNRSEFFDNWIFWDGEPFRLYWHDLKTGKERRIASRLWLESGTWLPVDPFLPA